MPPAETYRDSGNRLLDRISPDDMDRLAPSLRRVTFELRQVPQQPGAEAEYVYFPTTAMISLLVVPEDDEPVEVLTVGREGMAGLSAAWGTGAARTGSCARWGGGPPAAGPRDPAGDGFVAGAGRGDPPVLGVRARGVSQAVACNALHPVEERACRWLLMCHDQAGGDEFPATHEFMAYMLGVRRQTVTVVAGTLQQSGLIRYTRGRVRVLDRAGLEAGSCECYATIAAAYDAAFS
jgi:CRP-like cAMP-binding protein